MSVNLVTFDINNVEDKAANDLYSKAEEYFKKMSSFCKPTKNVYLIETTNDRAAIRDDLKAIFGDDCCILVVGLDGSYSSYNYKTINEKITELLS